MYFVVLQCTLAVLSYWIHNVYYTLSNVVLDFRNVHIVGLSLDSIADFSFQNANLTAPTIFPSPFERYLPESGIIRQVGPAAGSLSLYLCAFQLLSKSRNLFSPLLIIIDYL